MGLRKVATGTAASPTRVYEDRDAALARFRLNPEQLCAHPGIVGFLAKHALRRVDAGFTWQFDPRLFDELEMGIDQADKFLGMNCCAEWLLGEHSTDDGAPDADYMREISHGSLPILTLPGTHHHFILDDPMARLMAIQGILSAWPH